MGPNKLPQQLLLGKLWVTAQLHPVNLKLPPSRLCVCMWVRVGGCAYLFSRIQLSVTPWTVARQAPLSMGFSRQGY